MTAKRRKKLTKAQRRRLKRQRMLMRFSLIGVTALCIGAIVLMAWLNGRPEPLDNPVAQATAQPTPEATETPVATATPEPTPTPTPVPTEEPKPKLITITAVGDCTLGGNTNKGGEGEERFMDAFKKNGPDYFLQNFKPLFESDDLTVANLEGPLTDATDKRSGRTFNFRGGSEYAKILSGSGVDVCTVANNHAYDFKDEGLTDTAAALQAQNLGVCGFGYEDFREVDGITIGNLGFTEWDYEEDEIASAVRTAKEKCDLLIVSIHWGEELEDEHDRTTEKLGKMIVDAGADLVIGNHSHIRGEIMKYNGKYIIYSTGNFCFGGNKKPTDMRCIVFQQTFKIELDGTVKDNGINLIPARVSANKKQNDFQPVYLEGEEAEKLLKEVSRLSDLSEEDTIWMPDAYVVQHGIVGEDARIANNNV